MSLNMILYLQTVHIEIFPINKWEKYYPQHVHEHKHNTNLIQRHQQKTEVQPNKQTNTKKVMSPWLNL